MGGTPRQCSERCNSVVREWGRRGARGGGEFRPVSALQTFFFFAILWNNILFLPPFFCFVWAFVAACSLLVVYRVGSSLLCPLWLVIARWAAVAAGPLFVAYRFGSPMLIRFGIMFCSWWCS